MAASEKRADLEPYFVRTVRSLQSGLASANREIRRNQRILGEWEARILYSLDCVADRVGFESAKKRIFNNMQMHGWHHAKKRIFNNMQMHGWHRNAWKAMQGSLNGL
jgi:hypothetical protein